MLNFRISNIVSDTSWLFLQSNAKWDTVARYYFYSAADGAVSKVEYTFGYKRNDDGKIRIYLHHSSLPYPGKTA